MQQMIETVVTPTYADPLETLLARSRIIFGNLQMLQVSAAKNRANSLGQLMAGQKAVRFQDTPFPVSPLGFYRIQPETSRG